VTVHIPTIKGGPAGDVGLGALAAVVRFMYATGPSHQDAGRTDDQAVELFAAFLAGHDRPARPPRR